MIRRVLLIVALVLGLSAAYAGTSSADGDIVCVWNTRPLDRGFCFGWY